MKAVLKGFAILPLLLLNQFSRCRLVKICGIIFLKISPFGTATGINYCDNIFFFKLYYDYEKVNAPDRLAIDWNAI